MSPAPLTSATSMKGLSMQQQLTALHQISVVLSRSLDLEQTLSSMLVITSYSIHYTKLYEGMRI